MTVDTAYEAAIEDVKKSEQTYPKLSPRVESSIPAPPFGFKEPQEEHIVRKAPSSALKKPLSTDGIYSSLVSTSLIMKIQRPKKRDSISDDESEMISIVEETSSDLKFFETSSEFKLFKEQQQRLQTQEKEIAENNNDSKKGNDDESSTSPLTNNADSNKDGETGRRSQGFNTNSDDSSVDEELADYEKILEFIKQFRRTCGKWINNSKVQIFMIVLIAINAAMMGIATYPFVRDDTDLNDTFETIDLIFLIIFTIELAMQFIYHGFRLFLDGWLLFDFLVISLSWGTYKRDAASVQIFRAVRVFRAFRLVTRVKMMKDLINALFSVMNRIAAIFVMLALIFYIFAVMFTQLFSDYYKEQNFIRCGKEGEDGEVIVNYFGKLECSFLTLFQIMTFDEWATIVHDLEPEYAVVAPLLIITFVVISGFIVVNLVVAVICDAISDLDDSDKAKLHGGFDDDYDTQSETDKLELREQLDSIEDQIGDLTRIQARTFHTLEYLTQQLRVQKNSTRGSVTSIQSSSGHDRQTEKRRSFEEKKARRNSDEKKDRRPNVLTKQRSKEKRSTRKGLARGGYSDKRITYTDTWTQEGSEKTMRMNMVTKLARSARELQKMREREEVEDNEIPRHSRSARELLRKPESGEGDIKNMSMAEATRQLMKMQKNKEEFAEDSD